MPANPSIDRWVKRYASRLQLGELLHSAAEWGAGLLILLGMAVLAVKLFVPDAWPEILWLGGGIVPALCIVWWSARRRRQAPWQAAARLDSALGADGLLMTLYECPDAGWTGRLPRLEHEWRNALPRLSPRRFASYVTLPALFAIGACLLPAREPEKTAMLHTSAAQVAAQELESLLDQIDEQQVFEENERRQLQDEVRKLSAEADQAPLTHERWEAVDALRERMKLRLESAVQSLVQSEGAAELLSALAAGTLPEMTPEQAQKLEQQVAEGLKKMLEKGALDGASPELQNLAQSLMNQGKLQLPSESLARQELLEDLQAAFAQEGEKLSQARQNSSAANSEQNAGEGESASPSSQALSNVGRSGQGAASRGRTDAELSWGHETDARAAQFKEMLLPKGPHDDPREEQATLKRSAPLEEVTASGARAARRSPEQAAGQATARRKLTPRHREAVRKYFDQREQPES